jgi:hypothetical protein
VTASPRVVTTAVVALLTPVLWSPPGVDLAVWRSALAEDVVDLIAALAQVQPAIAGTAADRDLMSAIAWPAMSVYELPEVSVRGALAAASAEGYARAAVICADAPDLPGMLVGKLLQPLTTRQVAVAPAFGGGLLGVASRLPAPLWLPELDLDQDEGLDAARSAAPRRALVAAAPPWYRLRDAVDFARLDPRLEGWHATRALLGG